MVRDAYVLSSASPRRQRGATLEWRQDDILGGENRYSGMPNPPQIEWVDFGKVVRDLREAGFTVLEQPKFLEYYFFLIAWLEDGRRMP